MYIKRQLEEKILKASEIYPVILLTGPRQVGKSTMLLHIKEKNRNYISLDDPDALRLAKNDPKLFFEKYKTPLIIDEIQRAPELFLMIKLIVDSLKYEGKNNNGLFWLTGSQKYLMMKNMGDSLTGRIAIFEMNSLSSSEIENKNYSFFNPDIDELKNKANKKEEVKDIYKKIFKGGMPKLFESNVEKNRYFKDYINTYLEKDVRELDGVGKINEFYDFIVYLAARTSQELHYDNIAKELSVSGPTIKKWVNILEASGMIFILKPFSNNLTNRLIKTPKVYFLDTGLVCYLTKWFNSEILENGNMSGAILETYVISEIVKSYLNNDKDLNELYYYRDRDQKEIDLLIIKNNEITPIEIKKNKSPSNPDKNFNVLNKFNFKIKKGLVICLADELIPYNSTCYYCPINLI